MTEQTTLGDLCSSSNTRDLPSDSSTDPETAEQTNTSIEPDPDLYQPTDEWDVIVDSTISGIDGGRQDNLAAAEQKNKLDPIADSFESPLELRNAVREISLARKDGRLCLDLPTNALDQIQTTIDALPNPAVEHFVTDRKLRTRINQARASFNGWLNAYKRKQKIPGWQEAGPANYNSNKFKQLSETERDKRDALVDNIDDIRACAKGGARQRALEEIGSSIAEQNANRKEQQQSHRREQLTSGQIVTYRSPRKHIGIVHRVNTKSVRIERPNPRHPGTKPMSDEPEPEYLRETIKLDNDYLTLISPAAFTDQHENLVTIDNDLPDTYDAATDYLQD